MKFIYLLIIGFIVYTVFGKKAQAAPVQKYDPVKMPLGDVTKPEQIISNSQPEISLKNAVIETPVNPIFLLPAGTTGTNAQTGKTFLVSDYYTEKVNEAVAAGMVLIFGKPELVNEVYQAAVISKNPVHVELYQRAQEWLDSGKIKIPPYLADVGKVTHKAKIPQLIQYAIAEILMQPALYHETSVSAGNSSNTMYAHILVKANEWVNNGRITIPPYLQ